MDKKNDSRWLEEILRIEKEQPFAQRKPDDERRVTSKDLDKFKREAS